MKSLCSWPVNEIIQNQTVGIGPRELVFYAVSSVRPVYHMGSKVSKSVRGQHRGSEESGQSRDKKQNKTKDGRGVITPYQIPASNQLSHAPSVTPVDLPLPSLPTAPPLSSTTLSTVSRATDHSNKMPQTPATVPCQVNPPPYLFLVCLTYRLPHSTEPAGPSGAAPMPS